MADGQDEKAETSGGEASEEKTESQEQSQGGEAPDLSSIIVPVGEGHEMPVSELLKSYDEARKAFHTKAQEAAIIKKQYEWADRFQNELQADPDLRRHIEEYYAQTSVENRGSGMPRGFDPQAAQLAEVETKVQTMLLDKEFERIRSEGLPLNPEQQTEILQEALQTKNDDIMGIYWKKYGPSIVEEAQKKAGTKVASKMKDNQKAYKPPPGGGAPQAPGIDSMTDEEREEALLAEIAKTLKESEL